MPSHSLIPPSSAGIWGSTNGCTGWVQMSHQHPNLEDAVESKEGVSVHEICERMLGFIGTSVAVLSENVVGCKAENGVVFTDEMFEAAKIYADDIRSVKRKLDVSVKLHIEERVTAPFIHKESFGTPDCWFFDDINGHLYVYDFKYGHGVVDPFENWQMMNYVSGILHHLSLNGCQDQHITVHIRIAQPRAFHSEGPIREWVVNLADLRGYFNILKANAEEALSDRAVLRSGSHCRYCNSRHACPAALKAGLSMYEMVMQPTSVELTPEALGIQLAIIKRAAKAIEYLETAFEEQAKALIKKGTLIPNFTMERTKGRLCWTKPTVEILELGKLLNVDLAKPQEPITPTQAKKLDIDEAVISAYSDKLNTGTRLVLDNGNKAKQIFN